MALLGTMPCRTRWAKQAVRPGQSVTVGAPTYFGESIGEKQTSCITSPELTCTYGYRTYSLEPPLPVMKVLSLLEFILAHSEIKAGLKLSSLPLM